MQPPLCHRIAKVLAPGRSKLLQQEILLRLVLPYSSNPAPETQPPQHQREQHIVHLQSGLAQRRSTSSRHRITGPIVSSRKRPTGTASIGAGAPCTCICSRILRCRLIGRRRRRRVPCTPRPSDRCHTLSSFLCVLEVPFGPPGFLLGRLRCLVCFPLDGTSLGCVVLPYFRCK